MFIGTYLRMISLFRINALKSLRPKFKRVPELGDTKFTIFRLDFNQFMLKV